MSNKLGYLAVLMAGYLHLFIASPAQAASLQLVTDDWGTNGVPTNVTMYAYVPDNLARTRPSWFCCITGVAARPACLPRRKAAVLWQRRINMASSWSFRKIPIAGIILVAIPHA